MTAPPLLLPEIMYILQIPVQPGQVKLLMLFTIFMVYKRGLPHFPHQHQLRLPLRSAPALPLQLDLRLLITSQQTMLTLL